MRTLTSVFRTMLLGLLSFILLTFALFIWWRHFSNGVLVSSMMSPHSSVPREVQITLAMQYYHLNVPLYEQYPWFIVNIFTGKWGYMDVYTDGGVLPGSVHYLILNTIPDSIFIMFIGMALSACFARIITSHRRRDRKRVLKSGTVRAILLVVPAIAVPLVISYLLGVISSVYSPASFFKTPTGPSQFIVTTPTHILFLDALMSSDFLSALHSFSLILPIILSVTIVLIISIVVSRKAESKGDAGQTTDPHGGTVWRKFPVRRSYMVALLVSSVILTEFLFGYSEGLGYYLQFLFPFDPYMTVWLAVYLILIYGVIVISLFTGSSILSKVHTIPHLRKRTLNALEDK